jgi:hypothetical protein
VELAVVKGRIDALSGNEIVIMVVWNPRPWLTYPTRWDPNRTTGGWPDRRIFQEIVRAVGGVPETPDGGEILTSRQFSLIGRKGLSSGQAWQSSDDQRNINDPIPGQRGNLKGYLQMASGFAYSFVSPPFIDTLAPGSDLYTHNVISIGDQVFPSATIENGDTGVQLVALDLNLNLKVNVTFTVFHWGHAVLGTAEDPIRGVYGTGVAGLAAALEAFARKMQGNALIILQTFGQGPWWGNTPGGSPS